jgi:hypothetical protein
MKHEQTSDSALIDLGKVTESTKGPWGHYADDVLMQQMAGLASD